MLEDIFENQGFNHITENILIKLDVSSLSKCRLVCKGLQLHFFVFMSTQIVDVYLSYLPIKQI